MSKHHDHRVNITSVVFGVALLGLMATGHCNACGCGPTRDYVGDYIDSQDNPIPNPKTEGETE